MAQQENTDQGGYTPSQGDVIKETISTGTGKPLPTVPQEIIELQKTLKKFKEEGLTIQELENTNEYQKLQRLKARQ